MFRVALCVFFWLCLCVGVVGVSVCLVVWLYFIGLKCILFVCVCEYNVSKESLYMWVCLFVGNVLLHLSYLL